MKIPCYGRLGNKRISDVTSIESLILYFEHEIFDVLKNKLRPILLPFINVLSGTKHIISGPLPHTSNVFVKGAFFPFFSSKLKKKATVIPINKNDDESDPGNYRPMSLLSIFSRMCHRLIRAYNHGQKLLTHENCRFSLV